MSDSNVTPNTNDSSSGQVNVSKNAQHLKDVGEEQLSDAKSDIYYNCDDDNENIVVDTKAGCETIDPKSEEVIDECFDKLHIDLCHSSKSEGSNSHKRVNNCYGGARPKSHQETNQSVRTDQFGDKQCDCNILEEHTCVTIQPHPNSANNIPCALENDSPMVAKCRPEPNTILKQHLPFLLKSQSLDLHNEGCALFNIDIPPNRVLPNIKEKESDAEAASCSAQSSTELGQPCHNEQLLKSTAEARQRPPYRTNVSASPESRPIYPNVPYSPYGSPFGSPRARRRPPLRESRRISIEKSGSFLQLNQYKLMDQIGQGSYGLVKLAYSEEDSTHYAMKILSKKRLLRQAAFLRRGPKQTTSPLDRVYREIAVLKKLDHPNVVKLVEVLDDPLEDSLYMVFELVKKGEVLSIPTDKPLSEERAWNVFRDTLLGLEYLHYQKIIHADLKPGNLLLTECGHVKIADLGVCNEFLGEDATMSNGCTAGTPAFRAPETIVLGKNVYCGRAADVWALGATLYSLIYGNVPFIANSIPILYEKIKNETFTFPETPKIDDELLHCISRMLEKDASQRITLPQLKKHPWVTGNGAYPLPTEDENCFLVQVDDEDINSVVRSIPKLDTLILIKTMLKNHSFGNPFLRGVSGKAPQPGGSRLQKFVEAGRSNSAPGYYHMTLDRQPSMDNALPPLSEYCSNQKNEEEITEPTDNHNKN